MKVYEDIPVGEALPPNVTKRQWKILKRHGYTYSDDSPNYLKAIEMLIAVKTKEMHESGFPYIQVFAVQDNKLYDLRIHDVIIFRENMIGVDMLPDNIIRFMNKTEKRWYTERFVPTPTLIVDRSGIIL